MASSSSWSPHCTIEGGGVHFLSSCIILPKKLFETLGRFGRKYGLISVLASNNTEQCTAIPGPGAGLHDGDHGGGGQAVQLPLHPRGGPEEAPRRRQVWLKHLPVLF